jgi:YaaC-like Protein
LTDVEVSQDKPDNLCPQPLVISTDSPEAEVWNHIGQLTSLSYVHDFLKCRLKSDFFRNLRQNLVQVNKKKREFNGNKNNLDDSLDIFEILSDTSRLDQSAEEITILSRQAIELHNASQQISLRTKPILLYYCYVCLARILFLSTYEGSERMDGTKGHGLKLVSDEYFTVMKNGSFQRFHDSYNWDPTVYLNAPKLKWRDLVPPNGVGAFGATKRASIVLNMGNCNQIYLHGEEYPEHELTREIMFTYAMSMLARYRVHYWNKLIEGKKDDIIWRVNEYLTSTQTLFPNLIYNQLEGIQYYFYPVGHELFETQPVKPHKFPWML